MELIIDNHIYKDITMKKIYLFLVTIAVSMAFVSCDPQKDNVDPNGNIYTAEQLAQQIKFYQFDKDGNPQVDGNYIRYESSLQSVQFFVYNKKGEESILASGPCGSFELKPGRGQEPLQTFYFRSVNEDGTRVQGQCQLTVEVAKDLSPEMKIICSNAGSKKWYWSPTSANGGAVWGNGGYQAGAQDGSENINGAWWGCGVEDGDCGDKFSSQLNHSAAGAITGEEYSTSYMQFNEDGTIVKFDKDGNEMATGSFSLTDWKGGEAIDALGNVAYLNTSAGAILWPYAINKNGFKPERFEVAYLSLDRMVLIYADEGTGGWSECTWWSFCAKDDTEGFLTNNDAAKWYWSPTTVNGGAVWGNGGYQAGAQDGSGNINGAWWGCGVEDGGCGDKFSSQLNHSAAGAITGEEYSTSYMQFSADGTISKFDNNGKELGSGTFSWQMGPTAGGNIGTLNTSAGAILWPYAINKGGFQPEAFEIGYISNKKLVLIYADEGTGGWSECTWWSFEKK